MNCITTKEYNMMQEQLGVAGAMFTYKKLNESYPKDLKSISEHKKVFGIRKNMSLDNIIKINRKIKNYNYQNNTNHSITYKQQGESDSYDITFHPFYLSKRDHIEYLRMLDERPNWDNNVVEIRSAPHEISIKEGNEYIANGEVYPSYENAKNSLHLYDDSVIKQGVAELFEENPDFSSKIYEALGFSQENDFKQTFKNSLWRGQESQPFIDKNGDLVLIPTYDSLFKSEGISFAENLSMAQEYGERYSKNPFIIEIDKNYADKIYPLDRQGGAKNYGKRVVGDKNEQRFISKENIIIPKDKFKIHKKELIYDFSKTSTLNLVNEWAKQFIETDIAEFNRYGESSQGYATEDKQYYIAIQNELKNRGITNEELLFLKPANPIDGEEIIRDAFNIEDVTQKDIDAFLKKQKELQQKYYNKELDIKDSFGFKKTNIKISEKFQITPQQKQQATFMFSEFLDVYLQDFEQVERILKEEKIIDKKCS